MFRHPCAFRHGMRRPVFFEHGAVIPTLRRAWAWKWKLEMIMARCGKNLNPHPCTPHPLIPKSQASPLDSHPLPLFFPLSTLHPHPSTLFRPMFIGSKCVFAKKGRCAAGLVRRVGENVEKIANFVKFLSNPEEKLSESRVLLKGFWGVRGQGTGGRDEG